MGTAATAPLGLCLAVGTWGWFWKPCGPSEHPFLTAGCPRSCFPSAKAQSWLLSSGSICRRWQLSSGFPFSYQCLSLSGRTGLRGLPCTGAPKTHRVRTEGDHQTLFKSLAGISVALAIKGCCTQNLWGGWNCRSVKHDGCSFVCSSVCPLGEPTEPPCPAGQQQRRPRCAELSCAQQTSKQLVLSAVIRHRKHGDC